MLIGALVLQKCATDALTWYTRVKGASAYSGASVSLLSEAFKYPVLAAAIALLESPAAVLPSFRAAATEAPWLMAWVGAAYALQNLLYFACLDHISAAGYQVLSQSKLIFTAGLMGVVLKKRFSRRQLAALALLIGGAAATQLAEASGAASSFGHSGNAALGCALTVLSALLSALPNVFYERLLKKSSQSAWVANLQLTTWILIWVSVVKFAGFGGAAAGGHGPDAGGLLERCRHLTQGFTPAVWLITLLKTMNCIIIPACLKYADNILYGYAKPVSIVLTCAATAALSSSLPAPMMIAGILMVLASMWLYGNG